MNTPEPPSQFQLPCRFLRSKEMYYEAPGQDDAYASGVFWCLKTHEGFGPDGDQAGKQECCASRSCYVG